MEEFDKKLLAIYGTIFFLISLVVFYVVFKGFLLLSTGGYISSTRTRTFYIIASIMIIGYVLFLAIVISLIAKGRQEDLRLQSIDKYADWRLR